MTVPAPELAPLRRRWGWVLLAGIVYFVAGWIALGSVVLATAVTVYLVGFMMIVSGVGEIISAFRLSGWARSVLWVLIGILYIVAGIMAVRNSLLAAVILTLVLGWSLVASGIARLVIAFSLRKEKAWGLLALSALVTIALGVVLLIKWPTSSIFALGIFMGIDLLMAGISQIALAMELRGEERRSGGRLTAAA